MFDPTTTENGHARMFGPVFREGPPLCDEHDGPGGLQCDLPKGHAGLHERGPFCWRTGAAGKRD